MVASPRSVLDVGCGAGQELLPYLGTLCVGIDVRQAGLVEGRSLFGARAPPLLVATAEALPFAGGALVLQIHHLRYYLRRGLEGPRELIHALRVIARGAVFELTGRQPRGEVFQLIGSLGRMLEAAGLAVVEIDESDRAAPIVVARRQLARASF